MVIPCPTDDDRAQLMMEMLFLQLLLGMILSECYALKTDMLGVKPIDISESSANAGRFGADRGDGLCSTQC